MNISGEKQINQKLVEFNEDFNYFKQGMFKKISDTDTKYAEIENRTMQRLEELIQQIKNFIPININVNTSNEVMNSNRASTSSISNIKK